MENGVSRRHLKTIDDSIGRRVSTRQAECARKPAAYRQCPCCNKDQRKHTSVAPPSKPSVEHPEVLNLVRRPRSSIPDADLPVASHRAPLPQPRTTPVQHDDTLRIHNRSVEEYQKIYHEVVDGMLKDENGRDRPYSLELGRRIKQKLWERLNRPMFITSTDAAGLVHIEEHYNVGLSPPTSDVDIS